MHVKSIFDSARLGLFSSANILQIADVALGVVSLLFLLHLFPAVVLTLETSEVSAIFVFTAETTQLCPQVFSVYGALPVAGYIFDVISSLNTKSFQIWSAVTGYGELCVCF